MTNDEITLRAAQDIDSNPEWNTHGVQERIQRAIDEAVDELWQALRTANDRADAAEQSLAAQAKPQGERVLLYRYPRRVYNGWRVSNSERDTGPECEYRYATLDSEEA